MNTAIWRVAAVLLVALLATSCASLLDTSTGLGADFDLAKARAIQDGVTTSAEVEAAFGRPGTVTNSTGGDIWHYTYKRVNQGRQKTWGAGTMNAHTTKTETTVIYQKQLTVVLGSDGVVRSHTVTESGTRP